MATYGYRARTGVVIERDYPMGEAPEFIEHDGREYHRIFGYGIALVVPEEHQAGYWDDKREERAIRANESALKECLKTGQDPIFGESQPERHKQDFARRYKEAKSTSKKT